MKVNSEHVMYLFQFLKSFRLKKKKKVHIIKWSVVSSDNIFLEVIILILKQFFFLFSSTQQKNSLIY